MENTETPEQSDRETLTRQVLEYTQRYVLEHSDYSIADFLVMATLYEMNRARFISVATTACFPKRFRRPDTGELATYAVDRSYLLFDTLVQEIAPDVVKALAPQGGVAFIADYCACRALLDLGYPLAAVRALETDILHWQYDDYRDEFIEQDPDRAAYNSLLEMFGKVASDAASDGC